VQNQIPPVVLSFGSSDPLGAIGVQADLASFAAMNCYGLTVITAILVGDTTQVTDVEAVDADMVIDQARTILEDVPVAAFKLGTIGSVENVSAIAEIVSDYPEVPLIFDPFSSSIPDQGQDSDDICLAISELIIPQTTLLVASAMEISRFAEIWREPSSEDILASDVQQLLGSGCEYVLVTRISTGNTDIVNCLFNQSGMVRQNRWSRFSGSFIGAGSTLSAALAALVANGVDFPEAFLEAQEFTHAALTHAQRFGMGKLIPDRYFWARESDEPEPDKE
jgi:hydroxymethylpyrimidine/phosphomethylpyrimidine kinase